MLSLQILILANFVLKVFSSEQLLPQGFFSLRVIGIEECPVLGENAIQFNLHLRRISMKRVNLEGTMSTALTVDRYVKVEYSIDRWGNGGWRPNFYTFKQDDACQTMLQIVGEPFKKIVGECKEGDCLKNKPGRPFCPIIKGVYECKDFDIKHFDNVNIPAGSVGKWRVSINFLNKTTSSVLGCLRLVFIIEPKRIV